MNRKMTTNILLHENGSYCIIEENFKDYYKDPSSLLANQRHVLQELGEMLRRLWGVATGRVIFLLPTSFI